MKDHKNKNQIDMLNGPTLSKILLFALPLAASSILQQLFNSADYAVVGRFAGSEALAAVGANSSVINLLIGLFVGLSIGANVVIANYIGQQKKEKVKDAVHTSITVALISGIFLIGVGFVAARPILVFIDTPAEVLELAVIYLKIYFAGMPFIMVYNFGSAVLRSVGDTKRPLYCLIISGFVNVILNLIFVILFDMSVVGVALATLIANALSAVIIVYLLINEDELIRLDIRKLYINKADLIKMVKIGLPAGIQGIVFSLSNVCIQSGINSFGTNAVAGSAAAFNYEIYTYYVDNAFCQAAVTFIGQNYAAGKYDRCRKIFKECMICGLLIMGVMIAVFCIFNEFFVGIYTSDPLDIEYGVIRLLRVESLGLLPCFFEITSGALRGMGNSMSPAVLTILGTCVLRIVWVYTIFPVYNSYEMLLTVYPVTWVVTGILMMSAYFIISRKKFKKDPKLV